MIQSNKLSHLTKHDLLTLKYIYSFRFVNSKQLAILLKIKSKGSLARHTTKLMNLKYINRIYDPSSYLTRTLPAIYYITTLGLKHLRGLSQYPEADLRLRYKDGNRSQEFIKQCLYITDIICSVIHTELPNQLTPYIAPSHYQLWSHGLGECTEAIEALKPYLFLNTIEEDILHHKLVFYFPSSFPIYRMRRKIKDTIEALEALDDEYRPTVDCLFLMPNLESLISMKRSARYHGVKDLEFNSMYFGLIDDGLKYGVENIRWEKA